MKSKNTYTLRQVPGDLFGGLTASIITIPAAMAYGAIVFAALGPQYAVMGIIAGLTGMAFLNIGASIFGTCPILQNGPIALSSLMLASSLGILMNSAALKSAAPGTVVAALFLIVFISGLFQILFGAVRLGNLIKFIPYPVIAGLVNGTLITIIINQSGILFGVNGTMNLSRLPEIFSGMQPLTLGIGLFTVVTFFLLSRFKKIPGAIITILIGSVFYYICRDIIFSRQIASGTLGIGTIIGKIPGGSLFPSYAGEFVRLFSSGDTGSILLTIVPLGLGQAVITSIFSLVTLAAVDSLLMRRTDSNRELTAWGIGNMLSSVFGGISGASLYQRTVVCRRNGGTSRLSVLISGVFVILIILFFYPLIGLMPKVVLAAFLIAFCFTVFDPWSIQQVKILLNPECRPKKKVIIDIGIMTAAGVMLIVFGIFEAFIAGFILSMIFFMIDSGQNIVKEQYSGALMRSNVERSVKENAIIRQRADEIRIVVLEGSLFFGTSDRVMEFMLPFFESAGTSFFIFNMKKVSSIDSTGAKMLEQIYDRCRAKGKQLILASIKKSDRKIFFERIRDIIFDNFEDAYAHVEDRILADALGGNRESLILKPGDIDSLSELTAGEIRTLEQYLEKKKYKPDALIFRDGDPGDRVYFISSGKVDIYLNHTDETKRTRIGTLTPGTTFGEMAIIDGNPRSASALAKSMMTAYSLSKRSLERLIKKYPEISYKIISGITRDITKRLRVSNNIVNQLRY